MSCKQTTATDTDGRIELLADAYAVEILTILADGPATAPELVTECQGSKVTIYRRLDRLEKAGFVSTRPKLRSDGNHCQRYQLLIDTLTVSISDDGLETTADLS